MEKTILISLAIIGLTTLNIAAFKYLGILAFFITAASIPFAGRILEIISNM